MRFGTESGLFAAVVLVGLTAANVVSHAAEIEYITVTATRVERSLEDVPATVSIISADEVEKNLSRDIRDLIRYEPGVSVGGSNRFGLNGFTIRGIGDDRVLTQVDGVPTIDEYNFGAFMTARRDFVDVDALKTVEIVRGPASSLYGSDALGGVVSFLTKDPEDYLAAVERPWYLSAKGGYSSEDNSFLTTATVTGGGEVLKGLLVYTWRDGEETESNGGGDTLGPGRSKADPQDFDSHNVLAKLVYDLNESNRFRITAEYYKSDTNTDILSDYNTFTCTSRGCSHENLSSRGDDGRERYRLMIGHEYSGDTWLFTRAKWHLYFQDSKSVQRTDQERFNLRFRSRENRERYSSFNQDVFGAELQLDRTINTGGMEHHVVYGFEYEETDSKTLRDGGTVNTQTGAAIPNFFLTFPTRGFPVSETTEYAFFLQDEIALFGERLLLTPGLRYDHYKMEPKPGDLFLSGNRGTPIPENYQDEQVSFKLGAVIRLNDVYSLYGQFAEGFRAPPYDDINRAFTNFIGGYTTLPNADLKSESSNSYEFGIRGQGPYGRFSLTGFLNEYENFIETSFVRGFNRHTRLLEFQPTNLEEAEIKGIEFAGNWNIGATFPGLNGFQAYASVAYARGNDKDRDQPLNSIDPMKGVFGLSWQPNEKWDAELVLTAVKRKTRIDGSGSEGEDFLYFATPGFVTLDLLGEYRFNRHAYINVGIFNLTDKKYWQWSDVFAIGGIGQEGPPGSIPRDNIDRFSRPGINISTSFRYVF